MNNLVAFYYGIGFHPDGYTLDDILAKDDHWLEETHNYIQWLFPLNIPSVAVPDSPVMDDQEVKIFLGDEELKNKLMVSFQRMLKFYGFTLAFDEGKHLVIIKAAYFDERKPGWITSQNHNYKRITRILGSLTLLGLPDMALLFFSALKELFCSESSTIGWTTFRYWEQAIGNVPT
jgi:hypothetical protein